MLSQKLSQRMIQILVPADDRTIPCPALRQNSIRRLGVDKLPDLLDCPKRFDYGKPHLTTKFILKIVVPRIEKC